MNCISRSEILYLEDVKIHFRSLQIRFKRECWLPRAISMKWGGNITSGAFEGLR